MPPRRLPTPRRCWAGAANVCEAARVLSTVWLVLGWSLEGQYEARSGQLMDESTAAPGPSRQASKALKLKLECFTSNGSEL